MIFHSFDTSSKQNAIVQRRKTALQTGFLEFDTAEFNIAG
jgi:hypothetical protein